MLAACREIQNTDPDVRPFQGRATLLYLLLRCVTPPGSCNLEQRIQSLLRAFRVCGHACGCSLENLVLNPVEFEGSMKTLTQARLSSARA